MNRVPLPADITLGKSYEYGLDVNLASFAVPQWQSCRRISGWAPTFPKVTNDVQSYDDQGAPNEDVTGRGFAGALTIQANRSLTSGLYLPEIEALLNASRAKAEAAVLDVRFYHKPAIGTPHPTDAGRALVTVEITRQNTGNAENEVFAVTLTGKGEYTPIANPWTGWGATAPTIIGITPAEAGSGDLVTITGSGFLTATAVTFDSLPAEFVPANDGSIIAQLPTDTAGTVPVVITNPAGPSVAFSYERGA